MDYYIEVEMFHIAESPMSTHDWHAISSAPKFLSVTTFENIRNMIYGAAANRCIAFFSVIFSQVLGTSLISL